jgi:NitT/TauT family transport system substrate-binding protein
MRKQLVSVFAICLLANMPLAFSQPTDKLAEKPTEKPAEKKLTPVTIQFCIGFGSQHTPYAYGIEKNIYRSYGIDLKILEGKSCAELTQSISEGKVRFGVAEPWDVAVADSKGGDIKMIMGMLQNSSVAFVTLVSSGIRTPKDFIGKKIGVLPGGRDKVVLSPFLRANGMTESQVTVVELPTPQAKFEALMSGKIDIAGHTYFSVLGWQKRSGKPLTTFRVGSSGLPISGDGLIVSRKNLTPEEKDLNCRMVGATAKAWKAAAQDPLAAANILLKFAPKVEGGDAELVKETWLRYHSLTQLRNSAGKPFGFIFPEDWDRLVETMKQFKITEKSLPIADYMTNEFSTCIK